MPNFDVEVAKEVAQFLGKGLQSMREERGWQIKQADMAREMDVHAATLSTWMRAERLPSGVNIDKIASFKYCGPRIYKILDVSPRLPDDPNLKEVVFEWYDLAPAQRDQILTIIREGSDNERYKREG